MVALRISYPDDLTDRYIKAGFWQPVTLDAALAEQARHRPGKPALATASGRVVTYAELNAAVDRLTDQLSLLDISSEDRIVVQIPNRPEFLLLIFALFRMGAIPVLALPTLRRNEIEQLCRTAEAVGYVIPRTHAGYAFPPLAEAVRTACPGLRLVLLAEDPAAGPVEGAEKSVGILYNALRTWDGVGSHPLPAAPQRATRTAPDPADVALLLLSGGTTGAPKLIPRTHRDYAYNIRQSTRLSELDGDSVYLAALPMAHNFALGCPGVLGTLAVGGTVVLAPDPSPAQVFPLIERDRVTVSALTPSLLSLWLAEAEWTDADLTSLRLLQVGGSRLSRPVAERARSVLGCRLQQVFGMAEGLLCCTRLDDPEEIVLSTQGRPICEADEIRIVDSADRDVPPGEIGHLLARGPYTVRGYYGEPVGIAFTADGYYRTGDLVRLTASGNLVVEGRSKDVINRGGEKIPAGEVEDHLLAHPRIAQAALVGVPDALLGERSCVFAVLYTQSPLTPPLTLRGLTAFLRERGLATHKLPDLLEVVVDLPRTGAGKVDKYALAATVSTRLPTTRTFA